MSEAVLHVTGLTKDYGAYRAVDDVSFEIEKGQVLGLLGPNGAGKSTTIQMLTGITTSTSGTIKYFGKDFSTHRRTCLQRINFASAYNTLQGRISVQENLLVFAKLYGVAKPQRKIAELLEYFEMGRLAKNAYRDLSAGERTRVNLAKSLLNDPDLILMDEPTASLDPDIADKTLSLIESLRKSRNLSILFTSHNMAEVERLCDIVVFLYKGKVLSKDTPANHTKKLSGATVLLEFAGAKQPMERFLREHDATFDFTSPRVVSIQTENDKVAPLIAELTGAGFRLNDVEVSKPTLEDVFLDIARGEK
ncbi:MAG TPA: ABC transporter ATP-binding protein [Candidatus Saccharimonadales bacterium]